jgi:hypothetical protein
VSVTTAARGYLALSLVLTGPACSDGPNAPYGEQETIAVWIVGARSDDAGVVLRLPHRVLSAESTRRSIEIAWANDDDGGTRIVLIGDLAAWGHHVVVRRHSAPQTLEAEVIEVAAGDGHLVDPSPLRAVARRLGS